MVGVTARKKRTILRLARTDGQVFEFSGDSLIIGRGSGCNLVITDSSISRLHCEIRRSRDDTFYILDSGSNNGTWINGRLIGNKASMPNKSLQLKNHDEIRIGEVIMHAIIIHPSYVPKKAPVRMDPDKVVSKNLKFLKKNFKSVVITMVGEEFIYVDFNYDRSGLIVRFGNQHAELFSKKGSEDLINLFGGTFASEGEPPLINLERSKFANDEYSKKIILRTAEEYNEQYRIPLVIVKNNLTQFKLFEEIIKEKTSSSDRLSKVKFGFDGIGRISHFGKLSKMSRFTGDFVFDTHLGIIANVELGTTSHVSDFAKQMIKLTSQRYNDSQVEVSINVVDSKKVGRAVSFKKSEITIGSRGDIQLFFGLAGVFMMINLTKILVLSPEEAKKAGINSESDIPRVLVLLKFDKKKKGLFWKYGGKAVIPFLLSGRSLASRIFRRKFERLENNRVVTFGRVKLYIHSFFEE